jgi:hypothetical protein
MSFRITRMRKLARTGTYRDLPPLWRWRRLAPLAPGWLAPLAPGWLVPLGEVVMGKGERYGWSAMTGTRRRMSRSISFK